MICDGCAKLIGKEPMVEPHDGLHYLGGVVDVGGTLERYCCEACDTLLQRILPRRGNSACEINNWTVT